MIIFSVLPLFLFRGCMVFHRVQSFYREKQVGKAMTEHITRRSSRKKCSTFVWNLMLRNHFVSCNQFVYDGFIPWFFLFQTIIISFDNWHIYSFFIPMLTSICYHCLRCKNGCVPQTIVYYHNHMPAELRQLHTWSKQNCDHPLPSSLTFHSHV